MGLDISRLIGLSLGAAAGGAVFLLAGTGGGLRGVQALPGDVREVVNAGGGGGGAGTSGGANREARFGDLLVGDGKIGDWRRSRGGGLTGWWVVVLEVMVEGQSPIQLLYASSSAGEILDLGGLRLWVSAMGTWSAVSDVLLRALRDLQ